MWHKEDLRQAHFVHHIPFSNQDFFFKLLYLSYISSYLFLYVRDSIVPPQVPASEPEPHRSNKENLSDNQELLKLMIICVILMTLVRDSGVIL